MNLKLLFNITGPNHPVSGACIPRSWDTKGSASGCDIKSKDKSLTENDI